ncbi:MAG: Zn-dependent dipeptidase microsomal dipeptidase [Planctomycetota bacterium]|nr:Zn-dependent dipeptidase microsomal dipeptidase [Planctomycetota bacterium]
MSQQPPRLIDLHTDWLLQYAPETNLYTPEMADHALKALPQAEGYLGATGAAILAVYRDSEDWEQRPDPWAALGDLITRIEAEFSGRLLFGPDDLARWHDDPDGLAWGLIAIEGFDYLIRSSDDLDRLPRLFDRGVRVFQPVYSAKSLLAGSSVPGDDRGLTDLGRDFLEMLLATATSTEEPRPILDLAHLNPTSASDVLSWIEADGRRADGLIPVYSHGAVYREGFTRPRALTLENLKRLRALGGVVGFGVSPPFYETPEALRRSIEETAAIPYQGRAGYEGIAIGTDFMGVDQTLPGLENAPGVIAWVMSAFSAETARAILRENGLRLIERCVTIPKTGAIEAS